jgi:isocitrate lyase
MNNNGHVSKIVERWSSQERWYGITRNYIAEDVVKLRGSIKIRHTLAEMGAERLWRLLKSEPFVAALGAVTGSQAVQQVQAGLKAIYVSGWQVAADANSGGQTYPDQSLYPVDSVPNLVRRINNAFQRADQIQHADGREGPYWFAPIVADAEAGFGGCLNAFELMKAMIEAGAAGVHFGPDLRVYTEADRRKICRRRAGRAYGSDRQDRRQRRALAYERHRRARPPLHDGRAPIRRVLRRARRA